MKKFGSVIVFLLKIIVGFVFNIVKGIINVDVIDVIIFYYELL